MKTVLILITLTIIFMCGMAQPVIQWQKSIGGNNAEYARDIMQLSDGNYIAVGYSKSNDGDFSGSKGKSDFAVVKLDSYGQIIWQKLYGGTEDDECRSFVQTSDGGFVLAGYTFSYDGDVTGNHGSYSSDFWIVKINSSGAIVWEHAYGGNYDDKANSIAMCSDGGFVVAGTTYSNNGDVTGNNGETDYWLIRLNSDGQLLWQKCLGGTSYEEAYSVIQTLEGGFIVAGRSSSTNGNVTGNHGGADSWVVKLSSLGEIEWQKSYGGSQTEEANSIIQLEDGNFVFFGYSSSNNGDVSGQHNPGSGNDDFWVVKLNNTGTIIWQKCLGGSLSEQGEKIISCNDGSFLLAGLATSNDGDVSGLHPGFYSPDDWLVKISSTGAIIWQKCLGGSDQDEALSVGLTNDGGCVVAGFSYSNDGDVTGHFNQTDWWIVKMASFSGLNNSYLEASIELFPNPCKEIINFSSSFEYSENITCTIYSFDGRIVTPANLKIIENSVDVSMLKSGMYFISLTNERLRFFGKIIKE